MLIEKIIEIWIVSGIGVFGMIALAICEFKMWKSGASDSLVIVEIR